jgi:ribosome modulation factor
MTDTQAAVGHNSQGLTEAEREALLFHHLRHIKTAKEELEEARSEYNRLRKLAKADGFKLRNVDFAMKCWEAEDEQTIADDLREQAQIAMWFNLPLNFQGNLFDADRTPADERAFADGKRAGLQGKSCEAPRDLSQQNSQKWIAGWHEGQRMMRDDLQAAIEKANAAKVDEDEDGEEEDSDPFPQTEAAE